MAPKLSKQQDPDALKRPAAAVAPQERSVAPHKDQSEFIFFGPKGATEAPMGSRSLGSQGTAPSVKLSLATALGRDRNTFDLASIQYRFLSILYRCCVDPRSILYRPIGSIV